MVAPVTRAQQDKTNQLPNSLRQYLRNAPSGGAKEPVPYPCIHIYSPIRRRAAGVLYGIFRADLDTHFPQESTPVQEAFARREGAPAREFQLPCAGCRRPKCHVRVFECEGAILALKTTLRVDAVMLSRVGRRAPAMIPRRERWRVVYSLRRW